MRTAHRHALRRNDKTWTPQLVAVFDTEFVTGPPEEGQTGTFRCAAGASARRRGTPRKGQVSSCLTDDPERLLDWVEQAAEPGTPLWLYGHNVAVDVQSSGLLDGLLRNGWRISRHGLGNSSLWCLLVRGRQSIHLCDSMSLFGCGLKTLGELIGRPKLETPDAAAGLEEWMDYCAEDVQLLMQALLSCLEDWEKLSLGRWTDTGPGCGWNALRHTIATGAVVIDPDPQTQAFERSAIYGGRRELLRFGRWPEPEYVDVDMEHAHLSVAASFPLPCSRGLRFERLDVGSPWIGAQSVGVVARCRVRTEQARYPLRTRAGVLHPVGEFETVLAGPELAWAREQGELLEVGEGCAYRLSHWASPWSQWMSEVLEDRVPEVGPALRQLLKGVSKTVWGRTAMRVTGTVAEQDGPTEELRLERGHDWEKDCSFTIVDHGWRRRIEVQDQEGDDSFPAILAWVQSWVRVLLGQLVDQLGEEAVAAVCSDGVLVAPWRLTELVPAGRWSGDDIETTRDMAAVACEQLADAVAPLRVRVKDVLHRVRALGPETIVADEDRILAGVPRKAKPAGAWTYVGEVWPSFVTMTQARWSGAVLTQERIWHCEGARPLRWVHEDGCCTAPRAAVAALDGLTWVLTPRRGSDGLHGRLVASQHPFLDGLRRDGSEVVERGPGPAPCSTPHRAAG